MKMPAVNSIRRSLLQALGSALALSPLAAFAAFPERAVRLIVPFAPGGNADIL